MRQIRVQAPIGFSVWGNKLLLFTCLLNVFTLFLNVLLVKGSQLITVNFASARRVPPTFQQGSRPFRCPLQQVVRQLASIREQQY